MKERKKKYVALWQVMQRECRRLVSRPLYLFCMVIAPLFCYLFFTTLMDSGLPQNLPAGVVDMDDSSTSRNIVRNLDAFSQTGVIAHYSNVTDARIAVQEGKITEAQVDVSVRRLLELIAKADEKPPVEPFVPKTHHEDRIGMYCASEK